MRRLAAGFAGILLFLIYVAAGAAVEDTMIDVGE